MTEGLQSQHPEVRQAAAYGWGVLGQCGGEAFARTCADVLPHLKAMIDAANSRSPENVNATENAISAVTKILHYNSSQINVNEVLPVWLKWLPVYEDEEELPHVYGFLMLLLEKYALSLFLLPPYSDSSPLLPVQQSSCCFGRE